MYVCICAAVDETDVHRSLCEGVRTVAELARRNGAGSGCGSCRVRICDMIRKYDDGRPQSMAAAS